MIIGISLCCISIYLVCRKSTNTIMDFSMLCIRSFAAFLGIFFFFLFEFFEFFENKNSPISKELFEKWAIWPIWRRIYIQLICFVLVLYVQLEVGTMVALNFPEAFIGRYILCILSPVLYAFIRRICVFIAPKRYIRHHLVITTVVIVVSSSFRLF